MSASDEHLFDMITLFQYALEWERKAELRRGSGEESIASVTAEVAFNDAFELASSLGWESTNDEAFLKATAQATSQEILVEGLLCALKFARR